MKRVFTALILSAVAVVAVAGSREGIAPRSAPTDYAVQKQAGNLTVGAARLSNEQLKNSFSSDLARGYVVVEVGIFPGKEAVDVRRGDFLLRASMKNGADLVRPATPETVAGVLQKKNRQAAKSGIDVYPHGGVGYSTGGRGPYGNRYPGGWNTEAGVGVGVGNPSPGPAPAGTDADRRTMETELRDKVLPEGEQNAPVAGYLYFPIVSKEKTSYQLEYKAADGTKVVLLLK
jgi:hypothetical protein